MFPSPIGDYSFSTEENSPFSYDECVVSVPYRGLFFLYPTKPVLVSYREISFRPLSGIILSLLEEANELSGALGQVSVPYRGLFFLYPHHGRTWKLLSDVSVPYRGLFFLYSNTISHHTFTDSFRPLSGIILSLQQAQAFIKSRKGFPSPIGDYSFSTAFFLTIKGPAQVSVPYRGLFFLYHVDRMAKEVCHGEFPSPIGDYSFSTMITYFFL